MGQQSPIPGPPSYLVGEHSLFKSRSGIPDTGYEVARERAGHFIRLINGPFVLPLETAGVCWMRILVSIRSLTRGKPSDYSISNDDINSLPQRLFSLALSDQYRKLSSFIMRAQRCTNMRSRIYRRQHCQYRQHLAPLPELAISSTSDALQDSIYIFNHPRILYINQINVCFFHPSSVSNHAVILDTTLFHVPIVVFS